MVEDLIAPSKGSARPQNITWLMEVSVQLTGFGSECSVKEWSVVSINRDLWGNSVPKPAIHSSSKRLTQGPPGHGKHHVMLSDSRLGELRGRLGKNHQLNRLSHDSNCCLSVSTGLLGFS